MMNTTKNLLIPGIACLICIGAFAAETNVAPASSTRTNLAAIPTQHEGDRTKLLLQRAQNNPGECDLVFIGDSLVERWEQNGRNVWQRFYGKRTALNLGADGDRTQHVLWRFEQGQLEGLNPKVTVIMIGSNNCNNDDYTEGEVLEGVTAIIGQVRRRLPDTKILLLGIFPRSRTFSAARAKMLLVNQALAKLEDGNTIHYLDIGSKFIEADGSISKAIMPDYSHLSERGYEIWAEAIEPKLREMLARK